MMQKASGRGVSHRRTLLARHAAIIGGLSMALLSMLAPPGHSRTIIRTVANSSKGHGKGQSTAKADAAAARQQAAAAAAKAKAAARAQAIANARAAAQARAQAARAKAAAKSNSNTKKPKPPVSTPTAPTSTPPATQPPTPQVPAQPPSPPTSPSQPTTPTTSPSTPTTEAAAPAPVDPLDAPVSEEEQAVLTLTNQYRISNGLPPVVWNAALTRAARTQCLAMAATGTVSHTINGNSPADRIAAQGYNAWAWGENLYAGFLTLGTAETAVNAWIGSATHRANLVNPSFADVGIGVLTVDGVTYFTQDFGASK